MSRPAYSCKAAGIVGCPRVRHHGRSSLTKRVGTATLIATAALFGLVAATASAHSGGWGITRGGAQASLVTRTLYPGGDYYGVVISAYRARCRGDFNSPNWIRNNQRYFNHLFCTVWIGPAASGR